MTYSQLQRREIYSARESPRTSDSAHTQPAGRCCRRGGAGSSQLCLPLPLGSLLCAAASGLSSRPQGDAAPAWMCRASRGDGNLRPGREPGFASAGVPNLVWVKLPPHGAANPGDGGAAVPPGLIPRSRLCSCPRRHLPTLLLSPGLRLELFNSDTNQPL